MRKNKFIKQRKVQAANLYKIGKKEEANKAWARATELREELREKKAKKKAE